MRQAQQTSLERMSLLLIDESPDRLITYPMITSHAARVTGISVRDYVSSGRLMAEAQIASWERYGHDALSIFTSVGLLAEALGSTLAYPEEEIPYLQSPALDTVSQDEIERLAGRDGDWIGRGKLQEYLDAVERCHQAVGDRVIVLTYVPAPFTTAAMLMGVETFLVSLIEDPPQALALLSVCAHVARRYSVCALERGGIPMLADPLASGSVISADFFNRFVKPFTREVLVYLRDRYDLDTMLHVCGRGDAILDELGDCGAELISLDQVNLTKAVAALGDRARLIGNLSPSLLLSSQHDKMRCELERMIAIGKSARKGFIAATGCEVPIGAPPESVEDFVRTCHEFGRLEEVSA